MVHAEGRKKKEEGIYFAKSCMRMRIVGPVLVALDGRRKKREE